MDGNLVCLTDVRGLKPDPPTGTDKPKRESSHQNKSGSTPGGKTGPSSKYPESYLKKGTEVDMSKAPESHKTKSGKTVKTTQNAIGVNRNHAWYWDQVRKAHPEYFDTPNNIKIDQGKAPVVNEQWIKHHAEHKNWNGQELHHHHKNHGKMAYALPSKLHIGKGYTKLWHSFIRSGGKYKRMNLSKGGMLTLFFIGSSIYAVADSETPYETAIDEATTWGVDLGLNATVFVITKSVPLTSAFTLMFSLEPKPDDWEPWGKDFGYDAFDREYDVTRTQDYIDYENDYNNYDEGSFIYIYLKILSTMPQD